MKLWLVLSCSVWLHANELNTTLTDVEAIEVKNRIQTFYWEDNWGAMDTKVPKVGAVSGTAVQFNEELDLKLEFSDPLLSQAQAKSLAEFERYRCTHFLKKKFPDLSCEEAPWGMLWEEAQVNDRVEDLVKSWLSKDEITMELTQIPVKGSTKYSFWSGDYWRMRWGLTSFRWAEGQRFWDYKKAVLRYQQPQAWLSLNLQDLETTAAMIQGWSPSEKYDLMVGDREFRLTAEQKDEGSHHLGEDGNVEEWFGLCHGWAPAAVFVPPPVHSFSTVGASGVQVRWSPHDVRGLVTLAWANGNFHTNFVGGRCFAKKPERFENGRIKNLECFDNNPSTFHGVLGNLLGKKGVPFIMDVSYDYQVWNQPVLSYRFTYFNPLDPAQESERWEEVAVLYDDTFKGQDRFQSPLTRGVRLEGAEHDDSRVEKVVGVIATIVYLAEHNVVEGGSFENNTIRITYTYDLELSQVNGNWEITGGEWHENAHPDFLWVPRKDVVATTELDRYVPAVDPKLEPSAQLTQVAREASGWGYPLCKVVSSLMELSSGESYRCPSDLEAPARENDRLRSR